MKFFVYIGIIDLVLGLFSITALSIKYPEEAKQLFFNSLLLVMGGFGLGATLGHSIGLTEIQPNNSE